MNHIIPEEYTDYGQKIIKGDMSQVTKLPSYYLNPKSTIKQYIETKECTLKTFGEVGMPDYYKKEVERLKNEIAQLKAMIKED